MQSFEIKAKQREKVSKKASRELRKEGYVPCVMYGGEKNIHFYAHSRDFRGLIYTPNVYIVKLSVENDQYTAILKESQFHPVTDEIVHLDFLQSFEDKKITVSIPLKLEGLAKGVREGGKLIQKMRRLKIRGLMKDLPEMLIINVEDISLGQSKKVTHINYEGIELLDNPNSVIATVQLTRATKAATPEEEAAAAAAAAPVVAPVVAPVEKAKVTSDKPKTKK